MPKLDDIRAVSVAESPDIICVVETWLSNSISDYEIILPGYQCVRCDRDRHGGGVLNLFWHLTYSVLMLLALNCWLLVYHHISLHLNSVLLCTIDHPHQVLILLVFFLQL